jgi:hypothetical protein
MKSEPRRSHSDRSNALHEFISLLESKVKTLTDAVEGFCQSGGAGAARRGSQREKRPLCLPFRGASMAGDCASRPAPISIDLDRRSFPPCQGDRVFAMGRGDHPRLVALVKVASSRAAAAGAPS